MPDIFGFSEEEQQQQEQQVQPVPAEMTPAQVAETAQPAEKPEGFFSQAGQALDFVMGGFGDERVGQQLEESKAKAQEEGNILREIDANIGSAVNALLGGGARGVQLPFEAGARVSGQNTQWANKPASVLDDDPLADALFEISKVLTPTLILAPVTGGMSVPAGLAVESIVETLPQDSAADLVAGRTVAAKMGEIYDALELDLGYANGSELTRDLIEGNTPAAQAILAVWGFGQNYGINWSATKLIQQFPAVKSIFTRGSDWIAGKLGKTVEEVDEALTNIPDAPYTSSAEPSAAVTLNTAIPRALSPEENIINTPGLFQRMLRDIEDLPDVDRVPGEFMFNLEKVIKAPSPREALAEAFADLPAFDLGTNELKRIQRKTLEWLIANRSMMDTDLQQFLNQYNHDFTINVDPIAVKGGNVTKELFDNFDAYVRNYFRIGDPGIADPKRGLNPDAPYVGIAVARYILEDMGYMMQKVGSQLDDMLARNEDITPLMRDVFIPLERTVQTFAYPFRRAKRDWYLRGETQQREFLSPGREYAQDAVEDNLDKIIIDKMPTAETIGDLWTAAQMGDNKAFDTLKTYIKNLKLGDPAKVVADNEISTTIIRDQLRKKDATTKFFYNGMMLGQIGTQFNAAVPTVFRQVMEPLALAGSINPSVSSAERMYGFGQFWGGMKYMNKSWSALFRALNTNKPAAGYAKYSTNYSSNLLKEQAQIQKLHAELQIQMAEEGANFFERLQARAWGWWQVAMFDPKANLASRGLMASDESARVTTGVQVASGRAFRDAHLGKIKPEQIGQQTEAYLKQIFRGDPAYANIRDPEVKALADTITMQTPLKIDDDSSLLDRYFAAEDAAAKMSPIHRFFSPFNRVAGAQLQQELVTQTAMVPGAQAFIGKGMPGMKKFSKLYQKGDATQKLQLESQLALSQWLTLSTISTILFGGKITGSVVSPGEPQNSIIIPAPWTRKGEIALPYSKFSPYGVVLNNVANTVREFQTGAISHGQYERSIANVIYGYAAFGLNKAVLQGQQQLQKILDFQNFEPWMLALIDTSLSAFTPGIGRELGALLDPYQANTGDRTSIERRAAAGFLNQATGAAFMPKKYDIYAKEKTDPETKFPLPKDGNPFTRRVMGLLNFMYPGNVTETDYSDPVKGMFRAAGYETYYNLTNKIGAAYLTQEQQSSLQYEMQGVLYKELDRFRNDQYMRGNKPVGLWRKYKNRLKEYGPDDINTQKALNEFHERLDDIHFKVKDAAVEASGLNQDPTLREQIEKVKRERLSPELSSVPREGLYAQAAQQDTPLANQVRALLDIA